MQNRTHCGYPATEPIDISKVLHGFGDFRIPVIVLIGEISGSAVKPARVLNFDLIGKPIKMKLI